MLKTLLGASIFLIFFQGGYICCLSQYFKYNELVNKCLVWRQQKKKIFTFNRILQNGLRLIYYGDKVW